MTDIHNNDGVIEEWRNPRGWKTVAVMIFISLFLIAVGALVYLTGGTAFGWLNMMYIPIILASAVYRVPGV